MNKEHLKNSLSQDQIREYLAIERTEMAGERTFLAFIRTGLTFIISGITFIKFFGSLWIIILGGFFIPVGLITIYYGFLKYRKTKCLLKELKNEQYSE